MSKAVHGGLAVFLNNGFVSQNTTHQYFSLNEMIFTMGKLLLVCKELHHLVRYSSSALLLLGRKLTPCEMCIQGTSPFLEQQCSAADMPLAFCRRAYYLRSLRLMNAKCLVTKSSRTSTGTEWNYPAVRDLLEYTIAKAIKKKFFGEDSESRFTSFSHIHLEEGSLRDPEFLLTRSQVQWHLFPAQLVLKSIAANKQSSTMWVTLLLHLSESVCFPSTFLKHTGSTSTSTTSSSSKNSSSSTSQSTAKLHPDKGEEEGEEVKEDEGEEGAVPGFSLDDDSRLYLFCGYERGTSERSSQESVGVTSACLSLSYKYLAAVHVTCNQGKEVALLAIVQGHLISAAVQQGLSLSRQDPRKRRSLRKRVLSICGMQ